MSWLVLPAGYAVLELLATLDWVQVAKRTGLKFSAPLLINGFRKRLRGEIDGFEVDLRRVIPGAALELRGPDPGFNLCRRRRQSDGGNPELGTGDPLLDGQIRIEGDRTRALALLDPAARSAVRSFVGTDRGTIQDGVYSAKLFDFASACGALDSALQLATWFRQMGDRPLPSLLRQAATSDSCDGVRIQALRALESEFPKSNQVHQAAQHILDDPTSRFSLVLAAARLVLKPSSEAGSSLRNRAVRKLLGVETGDDPERAAELVQAQRELQPLEAQPRWLEMLASPEAEVRVAAAEALGELGDRQALPALDRAADGLVLRRGQVKRAAQQAIEEIHQRHGGTQGGEISVVPVADLDGAVNPADESAGKSEDEPEGGEVSMAD